MYDHRTDYKQRQYQSDWFECVQEADVRISDALLQKCHAVADEFVGRALKNLLQLRGRLQAIGYQFANPAASLVEANDVDREQLENLEKDLGTLPILLRSWYTRISSVDFTQHQTQLFGTSVSNDANRWKLAGLGYNCDLLFLPIQECLKARREILAQSPILSSPQDMQFLPIGGAASNCDSKGVTLPSSTLDAVIYNNGFEEMTFSANLRRIFEMGGFPFWSMLDPEQLKSIHHLCPVPDYEAILPFLSDGLLSL